MAGPSLNFPNAVTDERYFYGRHLELGRVAESLLQRPRVPVVVIGERRTGKTSLMNIAVRRLQALESSVPLRYTSLVVEPRSINSFSSFARAILLRLQTYLWSSWPDMVSLQPTPIPQVATIEQFEREFTNLLQYSGREVFLICIDEFDEIVRKVEKNRSELDSIFGLIYDLVEHSNLPVSFFFTMTTIPEVMRVEDASSMIAMAEVLELSPLEPDIIARMAADVSIDWLHWPDDQFEHLFHICGGHPYLAKLLLTHLLSSCPEARPAPVNPEWMRRAVRLALNDPRTDHVFENLYRLHFSSQEKEVLLLLARRKTPLPGKELSRVGASWGGVAKKLVRRHYLVESAAGFDFQAAFLGEWLRNWIAFEEECASYTTLSKMLAIPKEIEVDIPAGQVFVLGVPVRLSAQEFSILDYLSERAGQLVHREELVERIWETDQGVSDQVVDTAFYRLRKKIGDQGQYIETIPGQGFRLHRAVRVLNQEHGDRGGFKGGAK